MGIQIPKPAVNYLSTRPNSPSIGERPTWAQHTSEVREFTLTSPNMCSAHKQDKHGTIVGDARVWHSAMHTAVRTVDKTETTHISRAGRPQKQAGNLQTKLTGWDSPQRVPQLGYCPPVGGPSGARGSRGVITQDLHICGITYVLLALAAALPALSGPCRFPGPFQPDFLGQEQGSCPRTMWARSVEFS